MKRFITISILSICCAIAIAQPKHVYKDAHLDSLDKVIASGTLEDRISTCASAMYYVSYNDVKLSIEYANLAMKFADSLQSDLVTGRAYQTIALVYSGWGRNIEALEIALNGLEAFERADHNDRHLLVNNIGDIYIELGDYEEAYKAFQKALRLSREHEDQITETITMFNIGRVYKVQGNYNMALQYINDSKNLSKQIDDVAGVAYSDHELGLISNLKGDNEQAIKYLEASIALSDSLGTEAQLMAQGIVKVADIYREQGDYLQSLENYHLALRESERIKDSKGMAEAHLGLGSLQLEMNSIVSASESLYKGLGYAQKLGAKELQYNFYEKLSEYHERRGDHKSSLDYYKKYKSLSDSVFNKDINVQIALMETQFETEKKDKEIAQLSEQQARQNAEIEQKNIQTLVLVVGLILLIAIIVLAVRIISVKRKNHNQLLVQKDEIETKNDELDKVNRVKDKFFTIISHDLKSPFQSLSGVLELMAHDALSDAEIKKLFNDLKVKFESTNYLLENLLEWARVQMHETSFEPIEVQLYKTIEEEVEVIKNSKSKDVSLNNNVEKVLLAQADMNMFKLIIRNLVNNAVKFTKHQGNVEVLSEDLGEFICISVKDDGVGISKENQGKLFKEDEHLSTLGTELEAGTGLGLSLCKEFVEMHGGKIWVESEEGKGSTFKFTLKKAS